jgi:hypothetical protein
VVWGIDAEHVDVGEGADVRAGVPILGLRVAPPPGRDTDRGQVDHLTEVIRVVPVLGQQFSEPIGDGNRSGSAGSSFSSPVGTVLIASFRRGALGRRTGVTLVDVGTRERDLLACRFAARPALIVRELAPCAGGIRTPINCSPA